MITTGIIREINVNSDEKHHNNLYGVEISIFKTPANDMINKDYIVYCTASLPPGFISPYKINDPVYVGFVNNNLSLPVIIGKIYQGSDSLSPQSFLNINDLNVSNSVTLPENTMIGDISYKDLKEIMQIFKHNIDK